MARRPAAGASSGSGAQAGYGCAHEGGQAGPIMKAALHVANDIPPQRELELFTTPRPGATSFPAPMAARRFPADPGQGVPSHLRAADPALGTRFRQNQFGLLNAVDKPSSAKRKLFQKQLDDAGCAPARACAHTPGPKESADPSTATATGSAAGVSTPPGRVRPLGGGQAS